MLKEVLAQVGWGDVQASALVIFTIMMSAVLLWTWRARAKNRFELLGRMPLEDDGKE